MSDKEEGSAGEVENLKAGKRKLKASITGQLANELAGRNADLEIKSREEMEEIKSYFGTFRRTQGKNHM